MQTLEELARMLRRRNDVDREIARLIGRPALVGHIGEYVASKVFGIDLEESATQKGYDGRFSKGDLAGKTVNIKWYGKREGVLDMNPDALPDYFLVLAGPHVQPQSSRGMGRPWVIEAVYLFDARHVVEAIRQRAESRGRQAKIGIATSVPSKLWDEAEVYPRGRNSTLRLIEEQMMELQRFTGVPQPRQEMETAQGLR